MPRHILVLLAFALLGSNAFAYNSSWLGVQGGLSIANSSSSPNPAGADQGPRTCGMAGLYYDYGLSDAVFFRFEVNYRQGGQRETISNVTTVIPYDVIEVPVLMILKFGSGGFSPFILTGPAPTYAIKKYSGLQTFDFSFHLGGGVEYAFSKAVALSFSTRLIAGLFDVVGNSGFNKFQNAAFAFTFGVQFKI